MTTVDVQPHVSKAGFTALAFRNLNQITMEESLGVGKNTPHRAVSLRHHGSCYYWRACSLCCVLSECVRPIDIMNINNININIIHDVYG